VGLNQNQMFLEILQYNNFTMKAYCTLQISKLSPKKKANYWQSWKTSRSAIPGFWFSEIWNISYECSLVSNSQSSHIQTYYVLDKIQSAITVQSLLLNKL